MAKIESLNSLIKESESKKVQEKEKATLKAEKKAANKDQVITLDLENRNGGFREKASALPALTEKIKAVGKWISDKWTNRKSLKLQTFMPYEETTEGRYKAAYEKAQAEAAAGVNKLEQLQTKAKVLQTQREEVIALGDEWANQHEETSEATVAATKTEVPAPVVAEEDLREEWSSQHEAGEQSMETEADEEPAVEKLTKPVEATDFYKYPKKTLEQMGVLAGMVERAGVKVEGGFKSLAEGLKTGKLSKEQKLLAIDAIAKLKKDFKWDTANSKILNELSKNFQYETQTELKNEESGLGSVFESASEILTEENKKKEVFSKVGKLIERLNPLKEGNRAISESFINNSLTEENYSVAKKAITTVKNLMKSDKATVAMLKEAEGYLQKQFEAVPGKKNNVIEMSKRGQNSPENNTASKAA